jgi:hypothetical protein
MTAELPLCALNAFQDTSFTSPAHRPDRRSFPNRLKPISSYDAFDSTRSRAAAFVL